VLVVVVVIVATAILVVMLMGVIVPMVMRVCMAVTMIIVTVGVAVVASLAWRVIMSAIMLGLGRLLGCQQGGYSLTTVFIGLGREFINCGQGFESHGLKVRGQGVCLALSTWEFDKGATSLEWNTRGAEQSSGSHQGCGLLAGNDMEFDAIHVENL
jgi:hypothetical protein